MTQRRSAALAASCFLTTIAAIAPASAQAGDHISTSRSGNHRHAAYTRNSHLPSRGGWTGHTAASVVGRLAIVTADSAPIHGGRDRWNRVLSICPKGQYLAVSSETDSQYGVLMVDHSTGYIAKTSVRLLEYQVVNNSPTANSSPLGQRLVQTAQQYMGVPYLWGGETRNGIDCSAFVKTVFDTQGIELPRVSRDQATVGYDVPLNNLGIWAPGDRMYFACHHPEIDHTGMYIGDGYFIHASAGHGHQVAIDRVDDPYYFRHLVAVRRSRELYTDEQQASSRMAASTTTQSATASSLPPVYRGTPSTPQRPTTGSATITITNAATGASTTVNATQSNPPAQSSDTTPAVSDDRTVPPAAEATAPAANSDTEQNQQ